MNRIHLNLGQNRDEEGNLLVTVEELMNPMLGLCYAFIPDKENFKLAIENFAVLVATFEPTIKEATVFFTGRVSKFVVENVFNNSHIEYDNECDNNDNKN